jgi:hypothetical protein
MFSYAVTGKLKPISTALAASGPIFSATSVVAANTIKMSIQKNRQTKINSH